jgi:methyl-accepting chemotaxis protein
MELRKHMKKPKRTSFTRLFITVSLLMILSITVSLSVIFFYNLRSIVTKLTELNTKTNVARSQDMVLSFLKDHEEALKQSAVGISQLFKQRTTIGTEAIAGYLHDLKEIIPNSLDLYFTNNVMWNKPGGFAAFGGGWIPDDDWDNTQRDWFIDAKKLQGKIAFSEPYVDAETGDVIITLSMMVYNEGTDIGVAADDVAVNVLREMIRGMRSFPGQEMYIINANGLFITHEDIKAVMEKDIFKELSLEKYRASVLGTPEFLNIDKDIFIYSSAIPRTGWILVSTIPSSVIFDDINTLILRLIVLAAAMLAVVVFILVFFVARKISSPIKAIHSALEKVKDGDLAVKAAVMSQDEIGELSEFFNLTIDKIKNLVVAIKGEATNLRNIGSDLASNMQQTAEVVHHITANIEAVKEKVTGQSASVSQASATMEQVTNNIDKLGKNVEAQTESVSRSSSAIEEMIANIENVTQTLGRNAESVQELIKVSDIGRNSLQKVTQDIQEIEKESAGLLEINSVMENISSQTNLLSMNAAIEAAHAGEAGKGFAVVAGEIRKLAESSSQQSRTISEVLRKIKTSIDVITGSTNTALEEFMVVDEKVRAVSEQETNIHNAMEEQGHGSRQILEAIGRLNELTQMVKSGSIEMLESSKEVITESKNLEEATAEISNGMNEMAGGAGKINFAVNQVNEISKTNKDSIDTLFAEVSKFRVE